MLIGLFLFVITLFSGSSKDDLKIMMAHHENLRTVVDESQSKIINGDLSKSSSDINLWLTSQTTALNSQLQKKFGEKKVSAETIKKYADASIETTLEEAEQLSRFDEAYQKLLLEKLGSLKTEAQNVKSSVGGKEFSAVIDAYISEITLLYNNIDKIEL